jgi:integrase
MKEQALKTTAKRGKAKTRGNSNGSIFKMPDGRFRWQFTAGFALNGKQLRIGGITKNKAEAQTAIAQAMVDRAHGTLNAPDKVTFEEFAAQWLKQQTDIATNTRLSYARSITYACEYIGKMKLRDVRPTHVRAMLSKLSERKMKSGMGLGRTMSSRTLTYVRARVRAIFREAVIDGMIATNPTEGVKRAKVAHTEHPGIALETEQLQYFRRLGQALYVAEQCRLWPALFTAVSLGLRRGEVMGLRWCDVDLTAGVVRIRQNLTTPEGRPEMRVPKTRDGIRDIRIPKSLIKVLISHRKVVVAEYAFCSAEVGTDDPLFPTASGGYSHPDNLDRALRNLLDWSGVGPKATRDEEKLAKKMLGIAVKLRPALFVAIKSGSPIPRISVHDLRHTAATQLIRSGMPIDLVSRILGHSDITITRTYRHILESETKAHVIDLFADQNEDE